MNELRMDLRGEPVWLLAERALYRERNATLYVADLHLGKAATFRAERIAVPPGTTTATLDRLTQALHRVDARRLVVLGDFFHARSGLQPETLAQLRRWRDTLGNLPIELVRGNHDRHAGDPGDELSIVCHDAPVDDLEWSLHHRPGPVDGAFWLAGHVHPAVSLTGQGRQSLFLPCFHVMERGMVLPSFGEFTGRAEVHPVPGDRVFVIAENEVMEIPAKRRAP